MFVATDDEGIVFLLAGHDEVAVRFRSPRILA